MFRCANWRAASVPHSTSTAHATLRRHFRVFDEAFAGTDHLICYAMKALSNLSILKLFASMGSGFDIVSVGEMMRCLRAGADPRKIVFSGVGKTDEEIAAASTRTF